MEKMKFNYKNLIWKFVLLKPIFDVTVIDTQANGAVFCLPPLLKTNLSF